MHEGSRKLSHDSTRGGQPAIRTDPTDADIAIADAL
jgi:hypothetical protein